MLDFLRRLFDTSDFPSRWNCGHWTAGHGWLHILSDLAIFGAYTAIPLVIASFVLRRRDIPFPRIFWLFVIFIFACGTTHLIEAIIFWSPIYRFAGLVKLLTAMTSWATVVSLIVIMPLALRLPGLAKLNEELTREIEERKQTEAALRDADQWLRLAQRAGGVGTFDWNMQARRSRVSEIYREIFGLPPRQDWTDTEQWMRCVHPDDQPWIMEHLKRVAESESAGQEPCSAEYRIVRPDGEIRWVHYSGHLERDAAGVPVRMTGTVQDITQRKAAEAERENLLESERCARGEAEKANRLKDEFLSVVSHELRTPLNAISGYAQLLRTGKIGADQVQECVRAIERNSRAQAQIIDDLLDMSRIISGKIRLNVGSTSLVDVIEAAVGTVRPAADAKGIRLQTVLDSTAGPVLGDFDRLQQVIWNLLSNAVKFTPKGGRVQIALKTVDLHLEVSVSDTGEGISADFLPFVFDRFRQAESTTRRHYSGLGLGLAIAKHLVELHGGTIDVQSPGAGQGATVTVRLPLQVLAGNDPSPAPPDIETAAAFELPDLTGVRALVVDDEADARDIVRRFLEDRNAQVRTAASADEAIAALREFQPCVLLSDIGMPGKDGYQLIHEVRGLTAINGGAVPAVALTAFARTEDRKRALMAGYQSHIAKPIDPGELLAVVAMLCGRAGTPAAV